MKYIVSVKEVHYLHIDVEANTLEEAKDKAETILNEEDISAYEGEYSHTCPKDEWRAIQSEGEDGPEYHDNMAGVRGGL